MGIPILSGLDRAIGISEGGTGATTAPGARAALGVGTGTTNFTGSVNASTPNATVPVVQLLATNAATDVDLALTPKGAGAITAQVADDAITGGAKRGPYAVDLQLLRDSPGKVAAGPYSVAIGTGNTAGVHYSVAIGNDNFIGNWSEGPESGLGFGGAIGMYNSIHSNYDWSFALGANNTIHANYHVNFALGNANSVTGNAIGNDQSFAIGNYNSVAGYGSCAVGLSNTINSDFSTAIGVFANDRGVAGSYVWSPGNPSQTRQVILAAVTYDDAPTNARSCYSDDPATINYFVLADYSACHCKVRVVCITDLLSTTDLLCKSWTGSVLICRQNGAANTTIIGTPTFTSDYGSSGLAACSIAILADTTLGGLAVNVTGIIGVTLAWAVHVEALEVMYPQAG